MHAQFTLLVNCISVCAQSDARSTRDNRSEYDSHTVYKYSQGLFEYSEQVVKSIMAPLEKDDCSPYTPDVARCARITLKSSACCIYHLKTSTTCDMSTACMHALCQSKSEQIAGHMQQARPQMVSRQ